MLCSKPSALKKSEFLCHWKITFALLYGTQLPEHLQPAVVFIATMYCQISVLSSIYGGFEVKSQGSPFISFMKNSVCCKVLFQERKQTHKKTEIFERSTGLAHQSARESSVGLRFNNEPQKFPFNVGLGLITCCCRRFLLADSEITDWYLLMI